MRLPYMDIKGHWTWYLRLVVFGGSLGLKGKVVFRWWILGAILLFEVLKRQVVCFVVILILEKCIRLFWVIFTVDLFLAQVSLGRGGHIWGIGAKKCDLMLCSSEVKYFAAELLAA